MRTIPIIHCFDRNYVLPAAVCFQSLLEHANSPDSHYYIYVVGDIPNEDKDILISVVSKFRNASLDFRNPPPLPVSTDVLPASGHYSPALYHKISLPSLFPEYDKALVADVDVVYMDDIAKVFDAFADDSDALIAGIWDLGYAAFHKYGLFPTGYPLIKKYARKYTPIELDNLRIGAGLLVYNLDGLRKGGWEERWKIFAKKNAHRAILPEQEILNLTLADKIQILPLNYMAIAEHATTFDSMTTDEKDANPAWNEMYKTPIQMHYASKVKPWKFPGCSRAELWFEACARANMIEHWRQWYAKFSSPIVTEMSEKKIFDHTLGRLHIKISKRRKHKNV